MQTTQLVQVLNRLAPITDMARKIESDSAGASRDHRQFEQCSALITKAHHMLTALPSGGRGREVAQVVADALLRALALWNAGCPASEEITVAEGRLDEVDRALQPT